MRAGRALRHTQKRMQTSAFFDRSAEDDFANYLPDHESCVEVLSVVTKCLGIDYECLPPRVQTFMVAELRANVARKRQAHAAQAQRSVGVWAMS